MKNLGIMKILITFYSLIPTVLLYVKVKTVLLISACLLVCLSLSVCLSASEGLKRFLLHAIYFEPLNKMLHLLLN
jgi:hypothetical protein